MSRVAASLPFTYRLVLTPYTPCDTPGGKVSSNEFSKRPPVLLVLDSSFEPDLNGWPCGSSTTSSSRTSVTLCALPLTSSTTDVTLNGWPRLTVPALSCGVYDTTCGSRGSEPRARI